MFIKLLLCLFSLLWLPPQIRIPGPGGGIRGGAASNWSLINSTSATNAGPTTTSAINCTGASLIVIAIDQYYGTATPTDSQSNAYSLAMSEVDSSGGNGAMYLSLYYKFGPSVNTNMTFTETYGTTYPGMAVACFSGGGSSVDQTNGAYTNAAVSSLQAGSITPGINGELVISACGWSYSAEYPVSVNGLLVIASQVAEGTGYGVALGYFSQPTSGAINPTWSFTGANNASYSAAAAIVSIKP